jgi:endosialidase-like protein
MDSASETILALKPVTFRYKHELDPDAIPQFGLVAEQVAKVNPDLVVRDEDGKVNTVRYEAVNAMLLNEFLKERRRAEQQRKQFDEKLTQQQKQIAAQQATAAQSLFKCILTLHKTGKAKRVEKMGLTGREPVTPALIKRML